MSWKTSLSLLAALALVGLTWWLWRAPEETATRPSEPAEHTAAQAQPMLQALGLSRDALTGIRIEAVTGSVFDVRRAHTWQLHAPVQMPARTSSIEHQGGLLDLLAGAEDLGPASAQNTPPLVRLSLTDPGGQPQHLDILGQAGGMQIVRHAELGLRHMRGLDWALQHLSVAAFLPEHLPAPQASELLQAKLVAPSGGAHLQRREGRWQLDLADGNHADTDPLQVQPRLALPATLRILRLAEAGETTGLDNSHQQLSLTTAAGTAHLHIGTLAESGGFFARWQGIHQAPVDLVLLAEGLNAPALLDVNAEMLRDRRLCKLPADQVRTLQGNGWQLHKNTDGLWQWQGDNVPEHAPDQALLRNLLTTLCELTGQEPKPQRQADLQWTLQGGTHTNALHFWHEDTDWLIGSAKEPHVVRLSHDALPPLQDGALALRQRQIDWLPQGGSLTHMQLWQLHGDTWHFDAEKDAQPFEPRAQKALLEAWMPLHVQHFLPSAQPAPESPVTATLTLTVKAPDAKPRQLTFDLIGAHTLRLPDLPGLPKYATPTPELVRALTANCHPWRVLADANIQRVQIADHLLAAWKGRTFQEGSLSKPQAIRLRELLRALEASTRLVAPKLNEEAIHTWQIQTAQGTCLLRKAMTTDGKPVWQLHAEESNTAIWHHWQGAAADALNQLLNP